ncbi:MAG: hypothetical protein P8X55_16120 [Desulfosarcinaceae bacterium]|jgi:hypothetical protein
MIHFSYCCNDGDDGLPCFKVFDCWWEEFDVVAYLQGCLTPADFSRLSAKRPPDKVSSLLDLVYRARQKMDNGK